MIAHAEMGDRSRMAVVYQRCVETLRNDLGVEPSQETRALFEQLRVTEKKPGLQVSLVKPPLKDATAQRILESERKLVTALFVDLPGFTAISEKLDPEQIHYLMNRYFELTQAEVHR